MARLGIDFGTTNTIAVLHDRGIYSVIRHRSETQAGTIVQELYPSAILIERETGRRCYGIEADRRFGQLGSSNRHVFVPSLKRRLHEYSQGQHIASDDGHPLDTAELLTEYLKSLAQSIRSSMAFTDKEPLEVVITWPANSNGAQRHITRRCFRDAGFDVLDTLNEPTASAIELADCMKAGRGDGDENESRLIVVYDLGGGTFDASVVWLRRGEYHVLASAGIGNLGGDDFDRKLFDMFLDKLRIPAEQIGSLTRYALLRQVRSQKETISTNAIKSLFLNPQDYGLDGPPATISVMNYLEALRPMLAPSIVTLRKAIQKAMENEPEAGSVSDVTLYLVGGSSKLPLISGMVAEAFPGTRIVLTDKPFTSVAMGAAICATERVNYRDVFSRHFGLIRLRDHGRSESFDAIFPAGTPIPRKGEPSLEKVVWYHPAHNVGHLRYLECADVGHDGMPAGDVRAWSDIYFPYDPAVSLTTPCAPQSIIQTDQHSAQSVCEVYRCDSDGAISVEIRRPSRNDARTYEIYRD